ncbi:unnamed protein product [Rodentolepis nana]|uniref:G patch domain-containing protein 4 n=1 Tax=Rodentolepis nana TaxID=102285 RepID=A0A0R3TFT0_RODNA|nr:unnamed protein product [Rodentolepis nana]
MADFPSSFAKRQLEKFGWSSGSGLGKNNNGIAEPIKVKKKFSRLGLGATYDLSKNEDDFFDNLYNKAAKGPKDNSPDKSTGSLTVTYDSSKLKRQQKVAFQLRTVLNGAKDTDAEQKEKNRRKRQKTPTPNTGTSDSSNNEEEQFPNKKSNKRKRKSKDFLPHSFSDSSLLDFGKLSRKPTLGSGKLARAAEFI